MGVAASTSLPSDIKAIQQWQWSQVASSIKIYNDQEFPFGINASNIATMCNMKESEAKSLIHILSKQPDTGVVNALTVLSALICLGDELAGSLDSRVEALYDLVDFDGTAQVTYDELVVLLLCCGAALVGVLRAAGSGGEGGEQVVVYPDDAFCRHLAGQVYQELELPPTELLGKSEFTAWAISCLSELEDINVDNVYMSLYHH
jgi:hypothetical protein